MPDDSVTEVTVSLHAVRRENAVRRAAVGLWCQGPRRPCVDLRHLRSLGPVL